MKISKNDFLEFDFPYLLINIWSYSEYLTDPVLNQYCQWCVEVAKERWQPSFKNFQFVINNLRKRNRKFYDFGKISSADKNMIYRLITDFYLLIYQNMVNYFEIN